MYKMLVLDLDGTLLRNDKSVSPENALAVNDARRRGLKIVLATGRPPAGAEYARAALADVGGDFLITYNGALIQDSGGSRTLAVHALVPADYRLMREFAQSRDVFCYCFSEHFCLTPVRHDKTDWEGMINGIGVRLTDFDRLDPAEPIMKIMIAASPGELDRTAAAVPAELRSRFSISRSAPDMLEFNHLLASKGQAVRELASSLGIVREEIICVGDSGNDVDMIRYAGLGVAMGNAAGAVKAVADYVTRPNDRHGVAHVIRRYVCGLPGING